MMNDQELLLRENETGKLYCRGFDKKGNVLICMYPANENTNNHDGNLKHLVYHMERAIRIMDASTKQDKVCLVINYKGYNLSNSPPMKTSMECVSILQNHYPERLHRAYFAYTPFIFNAFYSVIAPFIDTVTKAKFILMSPSTMSKPTNALYTDVDLETLEAAFGGKDARPYNSIAYMTGPQDQDYREILAESEGKMVTKLSASEVEKSSSGVVYAGKEDGSVTSNTTEITSNTAEVTDGELKDVKATVA